MHKKLLFKLFNRLDIEIAVNLARIGYGHKAVAVNAAHKFHHTFTFLSRNNHVNKLPGLASIAASRIDDSAAMREGSQEQSRHLNVIRINLKFSLLILDVNQIDDFAGSEEINAGINSHGQFTGAIDTDGVDDGITDDHAEIDDDRVLARSRGFLLCYSKGDDVHAA